MVGCRGVAPTVEATGRSGLLPGAAAEVAGMPVCKVHHDDLHPSLQNPFFGFFPGPEASASQFHRITPQQTGQPVRRDVFAIGRNKELTFGGEVPAVPPGRHVGADFHDLRGVGIQAALHAIGFHVVDRLPRSFHANHQRTSRAHQPQSGLT